MAVAEIQDLRAYCLEVAQRAQSASRVLASLSGEQKQRWLLKTAALLRSRQSELLSANQQDIEAAPGFGLTSAEVDRLKITPEGIEAMAKGVEEISALPEPIGEVIDSSIRPNGLEVLKVRVPLGVIFFIYESRPNVTIDAAALCVKSGNAVILRGGKEAAHSNRALADLLAQAARDTGLPEEAVQSVRTPDRDAVGHFLKMPQYITLTIPRGGESLIRRVAAEAMMPVMKHFAGNCHVYIDRAADAEMAEKILVNSKCHRYGVCNAAESLLIHEEVAAKMLPRLGKALLSRGVEIRGDETVCKLIPEAVPARESDYGAEYLAPIISAKVVSSLEEAIEHIARYGSQHTEAIVTNDLHASRKFAALVDSAAVMVNASTRFNDGGQFGLGAEIGISTDKIHARGPCGMYELTSYKYVVHGEGHVR